MTKRNGERSIMVRLTPQKKAKLRELAEADGLTITAWVNRAIDTYTPGALEARVAECERKLVELADVVREVRFLR